MVEDVEEVKYYSIAARKTDSGISDLLAHSRDIISENGNLHL